MDDQDVSATNPMPGEHEENWQKEAEDNLNGWKRALSDYQNLKKQMEQERGMTVRMAIKVFALGLLAFNDNFEKALSHIPHAERETDWHKGLEQSHKMLAELFKNLQIEKIDVLGTPCDPHTCEAVGQREAREGENAQEDTVLEELEAGYMVQGEILRPAKVITAK